MPTQNESRKAPKPETRRVHDQKPGKTGKVKRPAPKPAPAQKPVYSDWAMI